MKRFSLVLLAAALTGCGSLVLLLSYVPESWKDKTNPLMTVGETDFDNPYSEWGGMRTSWRAWEAALVRAKAKYGEDKIPTTEPFVRKD